MGVVDFPAGYRTRPWSRLAEFLAGLEVNQGKESAVLLLERRSLPGDGTPQGLSLQPDAVDLGQLERGQTKRFSVSLANANERPIAIAKVARPCSCIRLEEPAAGVVWPGERVEYAFSVAADEWGPRDTAKKVFLGFPDGSHSALTIRASSPRRSDGPFLQLLPPNISVSLFQGEDPKVSSSREVQVVYEDPSRSGDAVVATAESLEDWITLASKELVLKKDPRERKTERFTGMTELRIHPGELEAGASGLKRGQVVFHVEPLSEATLHVCVVQVPMFYAVPSQVRWSRSDPVSTLSVRSRRARDVFRIVDVTAPNFEAEHSQAWTQETALVTLRYVRETGSDALEADNADFVLVTVEDQESGIETVLRLLILAEER